jgi:hypothetical protein
VPPPDIAGAGQTRLLIKAIEDTVAELKTDVREIKSYRHTDFLYVITMFAAGFLLLAGMLVFGYFRLDERLVSATATLIRVDTKLEDLVRRIPPVPTPPQPKR